VVDILTFNFIFGFVLLFLANGMQILKIVRAKTSGSVSLYGFAVTIIMLIITIFAAKTAGVILLSYLGLLFAIISSIVVWSYRDDVSSDQPKDFIFGFIGALFMVAGIAQAIKSYNHIGITSEVSVVTWSVWVVFLINNLMMVESHSIMIANSITLSICLFVLFKCSPLANRPFVSLLGLRPSF